MPKVSKETIMQSVDRALPRIRAKLEGEYPYLSPEKMRDALIQARDWDKQQVCVPGLTSPNLEKMSLYFIESCN